MAIVPDDKNWTWVLERTCDECGFDAHAFAREQVGSMVRDIASVWVDVLAGPDVAVRTSDDRWSTLEYACHVRDVFRIYDERLRRMLKEDGPRYANWDQDATAIEDRYDEQEPATVAGELMAAATALAERFDAVRGDQWLRPGTRSDGATFTVESFGRYFVHDPLHHLHDVGSGTRFPT